MKYVVKKAIAIFSLTCMLIAPSNVNAAKDYLQDQIMRSLQTSTNDIHTRTLTAQYLKTYWEDFHARIPVLSDEKKKEIETRIIMFGADIAQSYYTKDFALNLLHQRTAYCLRVTKEILSNQLSASKQELEPYSWLDYAACIEGESFIEKNLLDSQLIKSTKDQTFVFNLIDEIKRAILLTHLKAAIKDAVYNKGKQMQGLNN